MDDERVGLVLGIDPGLGGAVARLMGNSGAPGMGVEFVGVERLRQMTARRLRELLYAVELVVIEAQHASPRMSPRSAFTLGRGIGWIMGVIEAEEDMPRVEIVQPAVWRGAFGLGGGAGGKQAGITMARQLGGDDAWDLTHDEADAILLAWWGWRNVPGCGSGHVSGLALDK